MWNANNGHDPNDLQLQVINTSIPLPKWRTAEMLYSIRPLRELVRLSHRAVIQQSF